MKPFGDYLIQIKFSVVFSLIYLKKNRNFIFYKTFKKGFI